METAVRRHSIYALGHSEHELNRLSDQGRAFAPFTRQLFEQAEIGPGMRVLDVGSGAGDVTFLAAELVGPAGEVVGAECKAESIEYAERGAESENVSNEEFVECDVSVED